MVKNALEMEGTCTGKPGIGLGKEAALAQEVGADTILVMVSLQCFAGRKTELILGRNC